MGSFRQPVNDGQMYHQHSAIQFGQGCSFIDEMLKPKCGEVILDLGCGTGRLAIELASRVGSSGRVVGVDPNESRIAVAREELASLDGDVPVIFLDGSSKEAIPEGPFDAVFSNLVFHWFTREDRSVIIKDLFEMLKPGGRLVFQALPHQTATRSIFPDAFSLAMPDKDVESTFGMMFDSADVWLQLCSDAGFAIEQCKVTEEEITKPSLDAEFRNMEAAVFAFKSSMLSDSDVKELMKRYSSGHGAEVAFVITTLKVLARKPDIF